MPYASSEGRKIYYERQGVGPSILFCHGAGSNAATWWQQLCAFAASYTCITADIRCFGRSVAPLDEFVLPVLARDMLAILDQESIAQAVVVGQSLGGMIGLKLALRQPERVAGFVACDSSLGIDHPALRERVVRRLRETAALSIEQRSLGAWFVRKHPALATLYAQINHFNPSAHTLSEQAWQAALAGLLEPAQLSPMSSLSKVRCPTLLIVGSEDPIVSVDVMQEVAGLISGSELVVIDKAGHSAYFEKAGEFNRCVLDFIARRVTAST